LSRACAAFEPLPEDRAEATFAWLEARYGLAPAVFAGHRFWHRPGSPALWLAAVGLSPPPGDATIAVGLCAFRDPPPRGKPSTVFLQRFGRHATRQACDLEALAAARYLAGEDVGWPDPALRGWVVVRAGSLVLGRGWAEGGRIRNEIKRSWLQGQEEEGEWA